MSDQTVTKLSYWIPINVREERLNNLSDLAIGEAHGGPIGRAIADQARRNLAVLDEIEKGSADAVSVAVAVTPPPSEQRSLISRGESGAPGETRTHDL